METKQPTGSKVRRKYRYQADACGTQEQNKNIANTAWKENKKQNIVWSARK